MRSLSKRFFAAYFFPPFSFSSSFKIGEGGGATGALNYLYIGKAF